MRPFLCCASIGGVPYAIWISQWILDVRIVEQDNQLAIDRSIESDATTRSLRAAPLPGKSLVVFDHNDYDCVCDYFPRFEDAYAQEPIDSVMTFSAA